jgi:subtilase family serine protease
MKPKINLAILLMLMSLSVLSYAALDLKFSSVISLSPTAPKVGDTITFTVSFKSEGAMSTNVKIVGGIDGVQLYNRDYASISANGSRTDSFTWVATGGDHTAFFTVDPNHTAGDSNYGNNHLEKPITVTGGTSLKWDAASFTMTPASPKAGEVITFSINMQVLKGPVDNLQIMMGIDGQPKLGGNYIHWDAGSTFPVSFNWPSIVGNHTVYFDIDPNHTTNDENFADNHFEHTFTPQNVGTFLQWQEDSFTMAPASPNFDDEIMFRMDFKVEAAPVDNLKVVGKLDGKVIYERVFPTLAIGWNHTFAASWKAMSAGDHTLSFILDPNHTTNDQSFADNTYTKTFTIPQPAVGSAPNLTIKNLTVQPQKHTYIEGEKMKICFKVVNTGTIASPSAQVTVSKDGNVFINYQGTGILNPGQSFNPCFDFLYSCKKIEIEVDPSNLVNESNENDNKVTSVQCEGNKLKPFNVRQSAKIH